MNQPLDNASRPVGLVEPYSRTQIGDHAAGGVPNLVFTTLVGRHLKLGGFLPGGQAQEAAPGLINGLRHCGLLLAKLVQHAHDAL